MVVVTHEAEIIWTLTVRASVQGATFNMRGQLYHGQGVVPLRRAGKKNASSAFRLG